MGTRTCGSKGGVINCKAKGQTERLSGRLEQVTHVTTCRGGVPPYGESTGVTAAATRSSRPRMWRAAVRVTKEGTAHTDKG